MGWATSEGHCPEWRGRKSPWLVFWNEPDGTRREKSCGPGKEGWQLAQKEKVRIHNELVSGTYRSRRSRSWTEFRENFEAKVVVKKSPSNPEMRSRRHSIILGGFASQATCSSSTPKRLTTTSLLEDRNVERRGGRWYLPLPLTKKLRHLRAALRKAHRWGYLPLVPDFDFESEPTKLVRYITPEHFASLYKACGEARRPDRLPYPSASWWRTFDCLLLPGDGVENQRSAGFAT